MKCEEAAKGKSGYIIGKKFGIAENTAKKYMNEGNNTNFSNRASLRLFSSVT